MDVSKMQSVKLMVLSCVLLIAATRAQIEPPPPGCTGGQVQTKCGSACTPTCEDPTPLCTVMCVERCECPTELPILHNEECIAQAGCPAPVDGEWGWWSGWSSCSVTCGNGVRNRERDCDEPSPSNGGDDCAGSSQDSDTCNSGGCPGCTGGQVQTECGSACTPTCEDLSPSCPLYCVARCECPTDLPILDDGQCIAQTGCPAPECTGGQVHVTCGSVCTPTCDDPKPECTEQCVDRCQCHADLPLLYNGNCISATECPITCSANLVLKACPTPEVCIATCEKPKPSDPICNEEVEDCVPGCRCPNKRLWHNGKQKCVRPWKCLGILL